MSFPPGGHQITLRGVHCCKSKRLARQLSVVAAAAQQPPFSSVLRTSTIAALVVGLKVAAVAPVSRKAKKVISVLTKLIEYDPN